MSKNTKLPNKSKKYSANFMKIQGVTATKPLLGVKEALELLMSLDQPNYKDGASIELHLNLNINPTKSDQLIRSNVVLPHGTGKKVIVAAFVTPENVEKAKKAGADIAGGEDLINTIKQEGKINFDKAVAQPEMMKNLPPIARILGVAGVMPNPKTGTVGPNIEEMVGLLKAGKVDYKNDKSGNVHIICGKLNKNFNIDKLVENVEAALTSVEKAKPEVIKKKFINSAYLTTSQSPSVRIR